jgi:LacI family transcriptional regulator
VPGRARSGQPTIYDVAERAGVSPTTVSRVLSGHPRLRPQTRERVLQAVKDLRFVPNVAARQLPTKRTRVIAIVFVRLSTENPLLVEEEEGPFFIDSVIRGAERNARRHGYSMLVASVDEGDPHHRVTALSGVVDGVIAVDRALSEAKVAALARRVPVMFLAGESRRAATASADNTESMAELARHLVHEHGYLDLAFMSGKVNSYDSMARSRSFTETAVALGGRCEPLEAWLSDWTSAGAERVVARRLASRAPLPRAVACANDQMAIGTIHALRVAGVKVPTEVAVTGYDDVPVAKHVTPSLTTVRQPSDRLGWVAVEQLVAQIEGQPPPEGAKSWAALDTILPTELAIRRSCGCEPAGPTPAFEL